MKVDTWTRQIQKLCTLTIFFFRFVSTVSPSYPVPMEKGGEAAASSTLLSLPNHLKYILSQKSRWEPKKRHVHTPECKVYSCSISDTHQKLIWVCLNIPQKSSSWSSVSLFNWAYRGIQHFQTHPNTNKSHNYEILICWTMVGYRSPWFLIKNSHHCFHEIPIQNPNSALPAAPRLPIRDHQVP